ncbi:hypothetical protein VitviT2T_024093 [Vitis vinifera]|uniref:Uncharacterized protein n=1 Tax=Vitis vinifera TaxID=29760 RepID=A0ABY9DGP5_VITVI|nr:hypothetical protein VitviT2T_024093 [Vitis vinifera]
MPEVRLMGRHSVSASDLLHAAPYCLQTEVKSEPSGKSRMEISQRASGSETRPWTQEEDQKLNEWLSRSGKSCTERWNNHLDPNVKRENFSQEEDDAIICFQSLYGNSWESIAAHLPGRTDNDVKNRWYNHLKKKKIGRSTPTK